MNYEFDFNINNYTIDDLQKFLTLEKEFTFNDINEKCSKINNIIIENKEYDKMYKTRLGKFLEDVKVKLVKHLKEIITPDDGFIEDYDTPIIDNKVISGKSIPKNDNVGKIINPLSTSHQALQKNQIPSNSINPYGGNELISNYVFNTQFRDNFFSTKPENCTFTLPVKLKNVIAISLSAVQMPNVFFSYSDIKGTNQIYILEDTTNLEAIVSIPTGNYDITSFPVILEKAINNQVIGSWPNRFKVTIDPYTHFTTISNTTNIFYMNILKKNINSIGNCNYSKYIIDSNPDDPFLKNNINIEPSKFCDTMGYLMGYRQIEYTNASSYTSESMYSETGNTDYIYFCLNEYAGSQYMQNYGVLPKGLIDDNILALVPITTPKFVSTFADNSDYIYKTRNYLGPIDIQKITIKIIGPTGALSNLYSNDFSFNLQISTLYDNTMTYAPSYSYTL